LTWSQDFLHPTKAPASAVNEFNTLKTGIPLALTRTRLSRRYHAPWRYRMNPYKIALAATTALVASSSLSFATVVSQTESFSAVTDWGTTPPNPSFTPTQNIGFAGFNPALGTLNSVTITITDTVNGSVNLTNNGSVASGSTTVTGSLLNTLKYVYPSISVTSVTLVSSSYSATLAPGASSGLQPVTGVKTTSNTVSTGLASFETSWAVTAGDLGQVLVGSGNGNGKATYTDTGIVKVVASYNYTTTPTPSPEPATLTVLGSGLAGLGLLRRRRKSN
jgi:hypothetical protein